jgi:flagellar hook-associated protein 1 FlgK
VTLNLPSNATVPTAAPFDPTNPDTYTQSTSTTVYDSLGNSYPATFYFTQTATPGTWDVDMTVNGTQVGGTQALTYSSAGVLQTPANGNLAFGGYTFTVQSNASGTGDNSNAFAAANQQTAGVLSNGTLSVSRAVAALISGAGAQAQQVNTAQTAQTAVNTQAQNNVQSVSGVNLDEEAANLMQWQQAYQASAQALSVANGLFTSLLDSINGTYT